MATLQLIRFDSGDFGLQGIGQSSQSADFSLFDIDGEGGDPFSFGNRTWNVVDGLPAVEYDHRDSFWEALRIIRSAAQHAGINLTDDD